jgi:hypothetical protein
MAFPNNILRHIKKSEPIVNPREAGTETFKNNLIKLARFRESVPIIKKLLPITTIAEGIGATISSSKLIKKISRAPWGKKKFYKDIITPLIIKSLIK